MAKKGSKAQLEKLELERQQTLAELERLKKELSAEIEMDDVDDSASDLIERDKTQAIIFTLERRLEEIDHAIKHAQENRYGICERCGKEIEPERLEIFPEATLCVACKRETERLARMQRAED
ncbi:MAG: hypothetical protein D6784_03290 [Chloroflexi bacterium]|nr:MAG: hypothetical protein D6784_03290 [Chloroflexota bacterium]